MYLSRLRIRDFALVRELDVEFPRGIIAVTGETGAGKSTVLGSIQLLLGERAEASSIRHGCEKACVEGAFEFDDRPSDRRRREELIGQGFDLPEGEPLIVRRELMAGGRNAAFFAGQMVTVRRLGELMAETVDIHSQNAQQSLTRRAWQREAFDGYARALPAAEKVAGLYRAWREAVSALEDYLARERETRRQEDLWRFELEEIDGAKLRSGEEEELGEREESLSHAEEICSLLGVLEQGLGGEEDCPVQGLRTLNRALRQLGAIYAPAREWEGRMQNLLSDLEDLQSEVQRAGEKVAVNPEELSAVQERLALIDRLKKKYGSNVEEILGEAREVRRRLEESGSFEERKGELEAAEAAARKALEAACRELGALRKKAAAPFARAVEAEIATLGMKGMRFAVELEPLAEPGPSGAEGVEFRIANAGQPFWPLSKIASGGELSRLTLALKCLSMGGNDVQILFFDEIDAGISATVAGSIGKKMGLLGRDHQVFVITHMPVIAAAGDSHFTVSKGIEKGEARVTMARMEGEERQKELSRMLGGDAAEAYSYAGRLLQDYHGQGAGK